VKTIIFKTEYEIEKIRENSLILSKALAVAGKAIRPGITTMEINNITEEYILSQGAKPAFKGYRGFPAALCISVNAQVVHGIPGGYELKEGDMVSIDCGVIKDDFYSDSAYTFVAGKTTQENDTLMRITKESLYKGIEMAVEGNRVGDISFAIENYIEQFGYGIVRDLVGHGVGRHLHEAPDVPNFGRRGYGARLERGMVIAIEPMINRGRKDVRQEKDGWTITTRDGLPSAHYEHTVAIAKHKAEILTTFAFIESEKEAA
jgi:methionyl aminopeptidase